MQVVHRRYDLNAYSLLLTMGGSGTTLIKGTNPLTCNQGGQYVGCTTSHRGVGKRASR
jgi:hypothetical protein